MNYSNSIKNTLLFIFVLFMPYCHAQSVSNDSIIRIAVQAINRQELKMLAPVRRKPIRESDYLQGFYVNNILNNQPIRQDENYGIYIFGRVGDDIVSSGTILCDSTGCQILPPIFNYESLGLLLYFFERNHLSAEESINYLMAIYKNESDENNIGFQIEN